MDASHGQTSIFELDPDFAEYERAWIAAQDASGPVKCSVCKHPVHAEASTAARLGEHCAAKIGRAVMASRALSRAAKEANGTRAARRAMRRTRRAAVA
jgi:hypothetical protein